MNPLVIINVVVVVATAFFIVGNDHLRLFCKCKAYWNAAVGSVFVAVVDVARGITSGDHGWFIAAGVWVWQAVSFFLLWHRHRGICDHNGRNGKRLKAFVRSKLRKPALRPTRVQPTTERVGL